MGIDRSRRVTFEETADLYAESRPGYPPELVEDVIHLSGIPPGGSILEIGCGAGNATFPFAERGYELLGIELGERLAGLARERCRDFPAVTIVQSAFEEHLLEPHSFNLAISADAFHWIQPEIGYPKLIHALKPGGSIALFWQMDPDPQTEWSRALDALFLQYAPQEHGLRHDIKPEWVEGVVRGNLRDYCGIEDVTVRIYDWFETYSTEKFIKLIQTYSSLHGLSADSRAALHVDVSRVIDGFGGLVEQPYRVALFLSRVTRQSGAVSI